ncbi:LON peptidase substrate-binding domain-containing protein [Nocardioides coralli]|uniref:LON peptidase substrate-binding domain-containing protein n=1 Tax=Nocardioides coralli TaxID=2872154 RepID=UPI001CA4137D|nr:LON peptidase substrate-binding domain-containing protein [Nocardioides coralli]QZY27941.1 LON peptidase substrate-binding domain-containing protein [Nocardioides coralli]
MTDRLPMFPLSSVLFPGVTVPLRVFEDRYRALVEHLLEVPDPVDRVFGSVAIREGYEVGEHGNQSLYRVGCRVQMTEVEAQPDGTYTLLGVALDRFELHGLDTSGPFPVGDVSTRPDGEGEEADGLADIARAVFTGYRAAVSAIREDPYPEALPRDPAYLSWTLAAVAPLPMPDRQALLEADDAATRLTLVCDLLRAELRAINVIPSLPATEVARTRWSPN